MFKKIVIVTILSQLLTYKSVEAIEWQESKAEENFVGYPAIFADKTCYLYCLTRDVQYHYVLLYLLEWATQWPLHFVAKRGLQELVFSLATEAPTDVNLPDGQGYTALDIACKAGNPEIVKILLQTGAEVHPTSTCYNPLILAAGEGHLDIVEMLLAAGAAADGVDLFQQTPLIAAALHGHLAVAQALLRAGARANEATRSWTPLIAAATKNHDKIVKILLASTTDVNSAVLAETPLIAACRFAPRPEQPENTAKNLAIVHALLEAGADVNQGGDPFLYPNQYTPLQHAAQIGNFQVVQLLLHARADVNNMHNRGPSPLMCAVDNDRTSTVSCFYLHQVLT